MDKYGLASSPTPYVIITMKVEHLKNDVFVNDQKEHHYQRQFTMIIILINFVFWFMDLSLVSYVKILNSQIN